jgi:16S rRNA (cytosine967-C5)-methyltransferase
VSRRVAFEVLLKVENGAFADDALRAASGGLDSRDAGLAQEIVLGVLRYRAQLDFLIRMLCGPRKLDIEVRTALRMGIYQLRYLDRIPAHAAVSESVQLVKRARKASAACLVNAALRKVSRAPVEWPDRTTALSMPAWLIERWDRNFGPERAETVARAFLEPPITYMRGDRVQDIGAQSIVPLLDLQAGQTFLDVCSAPGNKTAQALEVDVQAIACDVHSGRLRALDGLRCARVAVDGTLPLPFSARFDRILVDAPCSGTGTLGRNPEIKWRLKPEDLAAHHGRQVKLLRNALDRLAPRGVLVYSTCSLEPEENEQVVERVLGRLPDRIERRFPGLDPGDGFFAAVIPSEKLDKQLPA